MKVADMSHGQLKLHYAAICQHHGCNGTIALGHVHRITETELRANLAEYEAAAAVDDWATAEDAMLKIAAKAIAA
jgi:hypothetical protein